MRKFLISLWQDESGAAGAEYALLLAIVAIGIATSAGLLGDAISGAMDDAVACIDGSGTGTCPA